MPATYSVNIGSQFEAQRRPDIITVLKNLPDNTNKLISPRDVREAFLTTWASSAIKLTKNNSGIEYIGIDSGNPANRDIKQKIFLGKRSFGNDDIMTDSLLNSDVDLFIYNTKPDSGDQSLTRMAFLAGTNSSLYNTAPYIGSEYNSSTETIDLVVRNPQTNYGSINLFSSTGNVVINGIKFPTVAQNSSATDGKILRYSGNFPNGLLKWDDSDVAISQLGRSDRITNIYGGTVSLNGYELEFVSNELTPVSIGGIPYGFSFSAGSFAGNKWPLSEVIRKMLYPKVPPVISATAYSTATKIPYAELATTTNVTFKWNMTIYPRDASEYVSDYMVSSQVGNLVATTSNFGLSFSGLPNTSFNGTIINLVAASYSSPTFSNFAFSVSDCGFAAGAYPIGFSYSGTASIEHVYPVYYGFSPTIITNLNFDSTVGTLSKYVGPYPGVSASINLNYSGTGYFYFIHQSSVFQTPISKIYDPNGFVIHDSNSLQFSFLSVASRANGLARTGRTTNGLLTQWKVWTSGLTCSYVGENNFTIKF